MFGHAAAGTAELIAVITKGRTRPNLTKEEKRKTELCRNITELGMCKYEGRCLFAHSTEELRERPTNPKFRTQICKTFHMDGFCSYGSRCSFRHDREATSSNEENDRYGLHFKDGPPVLLVGQGDVEPPQSSLREAGTTDRPSSAEVPWQAPPRPPIGMPTPRSLVNAISKSSKKLASKHKSSSCNLA